MAGAAVGETFLSAGGWLVWLILFDLVAISLLRQAIHVGLLEVEAAPGAGGPSLGSVPEAPS